MAFTKSTVTTNNISALPNKPLISATALKAKFDQYGVDDKTYVNSLIDQLELTTGTSGAENIGSKTIAGVAGNSPHAQITDVKAQLDARNAENVKLTGNQTVAGIKTFTSSPVVPVATTDTQAPQKKYVDDENLKDVHLTGSQTIAGAKTFSSSPNVPTPTIGSAAANKDYADALAGSIALSAGYTSFKNKFINGNFDVWQRNTSQTNSGYGSDDKWINANAGTNKTVTRSTFSIGQVDVPGNPEFFSTTTVTSVAGASNFCLKSQRIESVSTFSGQQITLSFYAKADSAKNISIEFNQNFGTGGTPSASVFGIGVTKIPITGTWAKYSVTTTIPSISGKTLGTNKNDYFNTLIWFDAGSSFDSRTNSLGQQSGTFDLSTVQIELGSVATLFENRPKSVELELCKRYYRKSYEENVIPGSVSFLNSIAYQTRSAAPATTAQTIYVPNLIYSQMRSAPNVSIYSPSGTLNAIRVNFGSDRTGVTANAPFKGSNLLSALSIDNTSSTVINLDDILDFHWTADADL